MRETGVSFWASFANLCDITASSMPPSEGFLLFSELQKARQCFVMESELHAVYLVTPFSVCYQIQEIDWMAYLDMWEKLSNSMRQIGTLVGVKESFLVRAMRGGTNLDYKALQIHKRYVIHIIISFRSILAVIKNILQMTFKLQVLHCASPDGAGQRGANQ